MSRFGLMLCFLLLGLPAAAELPAPALPEGISGHWISRDMAYNGLKMNMRGFHVNNDLDSATAQFQMFLQKLGGGADVSQLNDKGWLHLGTSDGEWFYSVQLRPDLTGVEGAFSVSELPHKKQNLSGLDKEYPDGMKSVMQQHYVDQGVPYSMEVLATHAGIEGSHDSVENLLTEQGWRLQSRSAANRSVFRKDHSRLTVFIQLREDYPGSLVLITTEGQHARLPQQ